MQHRIYIAGPYSAATPEAVEANVARAVEATKVVMRKGHLVHCPHAATHPFADEGEYEDFMALDFSIIREWATGLLLIGHSPGANRELELARELGLRVWYSVDEVPPVARTRPVGAA